MAKTNISEEWATIAQQTAEQVRCTAVRWWRRAGQPPTLEIEAESQPGRTRPITVYLTAILRE